MVKISQITKNEASYQLVVNFHVLNFHCQSIIRKNHENFCVYGIIIIKEISFSTFSSMLI